MSEATGSKPKNSKQKAKAKLIAVLVAIVAIIAIIVGVVAWQNSKSAGARVITVGVVGNADDDIWKNIQSQLDAEHANIKIETKSFQDGIYANQAQDNGELDLTSFQHYAFLNQEIAQKGYKLSVIGDTYIMSFNLYSKKYKSVKDFKAGDKVAIPNNPTNQGRALKVLDEAGLIKLKDKTKENPTTDDVASNPSGIVIDPVAAEQILNLLPDYAGGITNTNFVTDAGMDPNSAIYIPKLTPGDATYKPYVNVIVAQTSKKDDPDYKKIVDAYHTKAIADIINTQYKGSVVPMFKY